MSELIDIVTLSAQEKIDLIDRLWAEVGEAELLAGLQAETWTSIRERSAAIAEDAAFLPEAEMKKRIERLRWVGRFNFISTLRQILQRLPIDMQGSIRVSKPVFWTICWS